GNAIAQVLYGDYNPSGKLPMTFPRSVGQIPIYYNHKNTGRPVMPAPNEVFWAHYMDESNTPLYAFGHGLSFTTFSYANLSVENVANQTFKVSVTLKNTGKVAGKKVVQLYIRDMVASVTRPVKELKGFEMVALEPNQEVKVSFNLTQDELGFFNNEGKFIVEPGDFKVFVGGSSVTALEANFKL
nr:fibronectin type III-like domain-contianing protein [Mariniflexile sp.]